MAPKPKSRPPLAVIMCPVSDLNPYPKNARTHGVEQINAVAASIKEFGFTVPVLITEDKTIIAGHGRVEAAKQLGMDAVPTITAHGWTKAQIRAYVIADNRLSDRSGWDDAILRDELKGLLEDNFDVGLTGFDDAALASILEGWDPDPILATLTPELTGFTHTIRVVMPGGLREEVEKAIVALISEKGWADVSVR